MPIPFALAAAALFTLVKGLIKFHIIALTPTVVGGALAAAGAVRTATGHGSYRFSKRRLPYRERFYRKYLRRY